MGTTPEAETYWLVHHGPLTVRMQGAPDEVYAAARAYLDTNRNFGIDIDPPLELPILEPAQNQDVLRKIAANGTPEFIGISRIGKSALSAFEETADRPRHKAGPEQGVLFAEVMQAVVNSSVSVAYLESPHYLD